MAILREVITRFKFDTDEAGVKKVQRNTARMKRGVRSLAKLFGIGLGITSVRAMFRMGTSLERAQFNVKRFSGLSLKKLTDQFDAINVRLNAIKKGAGIKRDKDFFVSGAIFFKAFGKGEKQTREFGKTFEFAAKMSKITQRNVAEVFGDIVQGVRGGGFSFLSEIPGITDRRVQEIQDILGKIDPREIGGETGRQRRLSRFFKEISKSSGVIDQNLKDVPKTMLGANNAADTFKGSMDKISSALTKKLVPALEKLNTLLDKFLNISQKIENKGFLSTLFKDPSQQVKKNLSPGGLEATSDTLLNKLRRGQIDPRRTIVPRSLVNRAKRMGPLPGGEGSAIFKTTITINGATDPLATKREVKKGMKEIIKEAGRAFVQTEDR